MRCVFRSGPVFFYSILQRFHVVVLGELQHLRPCYFPILSNISIRVACLSQSLHCNLPLILVVLAFYASAHLLLPLRTCSVSLTVLFDSGGISSRCLLIKIFRSPLPWCPCPYTFVDVCVFAHLCYITQVLPGMPLGTLRRPPPDSWYPVPSSFPYPCVLSNFASYSHPPLCLRTPEFPLLGRASLLVRPFLAFCALLWQIHIRSMLVC